VLDGSIRLGDGGYIHNCSRIDAVDCHHIKSRSWF
jgi:hypothetical protein